MQGFNNPAVLAASAAGLTSALLMLWAMRGLPLGSALLWLANEEDAKGELCRRNAANTFAALLSNVQAHNAFREPLLNRALIIRLRCTNIISNRRLIRVLCGC
jgi:hypothetical protein